MYNQQIDIDLKLIPEEGGKVEYHNTAVKGRAQCRERCYTLAAFREMHIPKEGLWSHWFRCPQCEHERQNPKIAVCPYCDTPMEEMGIVLQVVAKVGNVSIVRIELPPAEKVEEHSIEVRGIKVIQLEVKA